MAKFFYTYVLQSKKDNNLYIGWSDDLVERVSEHNRGKVTATKSRSPMVLVYYEACLSRGNAIKREKALKTGFGRKYLKGRLK
ncbi:MAG: excinuclease ABC subunit C [Candidatus Levybacteria bacterium RIFCSPLOWO2_01_FULL_39_24]|nr:MAG: excinuclease ABC subunit C [Candidatus Levybacteria bacterium RIFCSPHIGHO2_01_FULL_40_16]OGH28004.1 MAG: excinuclease ABC subunit C [Candidatus Levybacteria bacterium RIFCSPHIGHO2_12_FULL_39_9]OGH46799.1 MAG: excinuclease ABC subunit C [Candidatus Levybacteria bacterium RIFCSPLOWO2_01_FULL_39_24]